MKDYQERGGSFFKGLVFGALAGAGVYYFLSNTKEGKKLKKQIKEHGDDVLNNLHEVVSEFEEKGREFGEKAKELQAKLEKKVKDGGEEAGSAKKELSQIEKLQERGRRAVKIFTRQGKPLKKTS